jgi:hypothetical protein
MALVIKTGDTFPTLVARFEDENGQINLSSAEKIEIYIALEESDRVIEGVCSVKEAEEEINGVMTKVWLVSFTFTAEDSEEAGVYNVEHKITWAPGSVESVPNEGYNQIEIQPSL